MRHFPEWPHKSRRPRGRISSREVSAGAHGCVLQDVGSLSRRWGGGWRAIGCFRKNGRSRMASAWHRGVCMWCKNVLLGSVVWKGGEGERRVGGECARESAAPKVVLGAGRAPAVAGDALGAARGCRGTPFGIYSRCRVGPDIEERFGRDVRVFLCGDARGKRCAGAERDFSLARASAPDIADFGGNL